MESVIIVDINPCKGPQKTNTGVDQVSALFPLLKVILETICSEDLVGLEQARKRVDEMLSETTNDPKERNFFMESLVMRNNKIDWRWFTVQINIHSSNNGIIVMLIFSL